MMLFSDTYLTVKNVSESVFRDRGSKFIGIVIPVNSEIDIKAELEQIRKKYYDATHHCYAFRLNADKSVYRSNDDGEPSGTAGKPILGQIQSKDLTNVLIVVVRYYGGTKLGVSGLINAYKTAARDAIEVNLIIEKTVQDIYEIQFEYSQMNEVMKCLKDSNITLISQQFDNHCLIEFSVRRMLSGRFEDLLSKINNTTLTFKVSR